MAKGPVPLSLIERAMRASIPEPNSGCWLFLGHVSKSTGYGLLFIGSTRDGTRRPQNAHRVAYCDVRSCINPDHMFLGTQSDNLNDAVRKGRWGSKRGFAVTKLIPNAKLTHEQIYSIRRRAAAGEAYGAIASSMGLKRVYVGRIARGDRWPLTTLPQETSK